MHITPNTLVNSDPPGRPSACAECGASIRQSSGGGVRIFCDNCNLLRKRASNRASDERRRRRCGAFLWADYVANERVRMDALAPKLERLIARGLSYAEAGAKHGMTRNAVAGMLHRWRNRAEGK